jgi:hypothetical protein
MGMGRRIVTQRNKIEIDVSIHSFQKELFFVSLCVEAMKKKKEKNKNFQEVCTEHRGKEREGLYAYYDHYVKMESRAIVRC